MKNARLPDCRVKIIPASISDFRPRGRFWLSSLGVFRALKSATARAKISRGLLWRGVHIFSAAPLLNRLPVPESARSRRLKNLQASPRLCPCKRDYPTPELPVGCGLICRSGESAIEFKNAVSLLSACTTKRLPSPRCASAIQIIRP